MKRETAILLATAALCLAVAEAWVAHFHPQPTASRLLADEPAMYRPSDRYSFELEPGFRGRHRRPDFDVAIEINSLGLRGPEPPPADPGRTRVLALGDSFTFGWGVEDAESWVRRLEAALRRALGADIDVLNAGYACGEYPDTYYLCLRERLGTLAPDLVLIGFYVGNDIDGTAARTRVWPETDEAGLPLRIEHGRDHVEDGYWVRRQKQLRYRMPVLRDSHLFHLAYRAGKRAVKSRRDPAAGPKHAMLYEDPWSEETRRHAERVERLLLAIRDLCREAGVPLAVLVLPAAEQVHPEPWAASGLDFDRPQAVFRPFFREAGIATLDLLPVLRADREAEPLYFPHDTHWTRAGHALAAEAVADFVLAELWASPRGSQEVNNVP